MISGKKNTFSFFNHSLLKNWFADQSYSSKVWLIDNSLSVKSDNFAMCSSSIFADYPNLLMSSFVCLLCGLHFPSWNQTQPLPRRPGEFLTKHFFVRLAATASAGCFLERKKHCILLSFLIDAENNKLIWKGALCTFFLVDLQNTTVAIALNMLASSQPASWCFLYRSAGLR